MNECFWWKESQGSKWSRRNFISKKLEKTCCRISVTIQIVSHLSSLNYKTRLACFDFSLFHFITYTSPVFPFWCAFSLLDWFQWDLLRLEPLICSMALNSVSSYSFQLISVRIYFVRWTVWECNKTMLNHPSHLFFSHSQSILTCPRRKLEQSDMISSWKIFSSLSDNFSQDRSLIGWVKILVPLSFSFLKRVMTRVPHSFTRLNITQFFRSPLSVDMSILRLVKLTWELLSNPENLK